MNISEKTKKWLIVTALSLLCVVLIIAIFSRIKGGKPEGTMNPVTPTVTDEITPGISPPAPSITVTPSLTPSPEVKVQPIEPTVTAAPPQDTGDSEGTEQSIQAEVTKPAEPPEEVKKDPSKKPDGEKVTEENLDGKKGTKKDSDTSPTASTPKSGAKNEKGQVWVPGFGWVDDSGDNVGTEAGDMYENGNKIGDMD